MSRQKATQNSSDPRCDSSPLADLIDAPDKRRLPPLLRHAWYSLNQAFRRRISHVDITPDQFTVLRWLLEGDPKGLTQRELADLMTSDPNTITSILNRMEKAEYIERKRHESDRRANRIIIKPAGKRAYEKARQIALELQAQALSVLPEDQRQPFLANLERVADACRDAAEQAR